MRAELYFWFAKLLDGARQPDLYLAEHIDRDDQRDRRDYGSAAGNDVHYGVGGGIGIVGRVFFHLPSCEYQCQPEWRYERHGDPGRDAEPGDDDYRHHGEY